MAYVKLSIRQGSWRKESCGQQSGDGRKKVGDRLHRLQSISAPQAFPSSLLDFGLILISHKRRGFSLQFPGKALLALALLRGGFKLTIIYTYSVHPARGSPASEAAYYNGVCGGIAVCKPGVKGRYGFS
jgi:hypothetical protein